jgi:hypothetical protein
MIMKLCDHKPEFSRLLFRNMIAQPPTVSKSGGKTHIDGIFEDMHFIVRLNLYSLLAKDETAGDRVSHGKIFTDSFYAQERKLYKRDQSTGKHQLLMSKYFGSAGKSCSTRSSPSSESECL